jgi:hypothetical protein
MQASNDIDLNKFCDPDDCRSVCARPFSVGEYSYATDGHILIRVDRKADISDSDDPLKNKIISYFDIKDLEPTPLPLNVSLPEREIITCPECVDGIVEESHDCPCCECEDECSYCNGTGKKDSDLLNRVEVHGAFFRQGNIRLIINLPNPMIIKRSKEYTDPMCFSFDGGIGFVMPTRI